VLQPPLKKHSTINLISIEVVEKLHLATHVIKVPYLLHSSYVTLLISHIAKVPFTFRGHTEVIDCGVSPMPLDSCHILLGYPWSHNYQVQHCRDGTKVYFKWNKKRCALLCAIAKQFHENHLLRKERTKEFCLSPKHKVMIDGGLSIICHLDHGVLQNPCENESHCNSPCL
jgi:hypothetical protein